MVKIKIFISSVQIEFSEERKLLCEYIQSDALLGKFFDPFIFENIPALSAAVNLVYLNEVEQSDIYLGIFGKDYGYEDKDGVSPTEREFDYATLLHKTRLIFISDQTHLHCHPKEQTLIKKSEKSVVRKIFTAYSDLKASVYAALVRYLEQKEYVRTVPFDATFNDRANMEDLDTDKIKEFVIIAKAKRNFPLEPESSPELVLTHLNLLTNNRLTNAAILLFGKLPQRFLISSEIKCAHFHGSQIAKPIPSYQVYKGDVFQLVNQAVDFVMSKIDLAIGTRNMNAQVDVSYELPIEAVTEAIVNAVAHRDYTSNGSVQVMLFKDRLEIWNPGNLPYGLTTAKLREPHYSIPANPLLAEPMYLAGYIERMGTGTGDIIRKCNELGLKEPEFIQDEAFRTILWRPLLNDLPDNTILVNGSDNGSYNETKLDNELDNELENKLENELSLKEKDIIKLISKNSKITQKQLSEIIGITPQNIRVYIAKLKQKKLLLRIGPDKGGHWEVVDTNYTN